MKQFQQQPGIVKKESLDESMPSSIIKNKEKIRMMSPAEKREHFKGKSVESLKQMSWRHGYGKDSDVYSKHASAIEEGRGHRGERALGKFIIRGIGSLIGSKKQQTQSNDKPITALQRNAEYKKQQFADNWAETKGNLLARAANRKSQMDAWEEKWGKRIPSKPSWKISEEIEND
jgi:hypothetical protein